MYLFLVLLVTQNNKVTIPLSISKRTVQQTAKPKLTTTSYTEQIFSTSYSIVKENDIVLFKDESGSQYNLLRGIDSTAYIIDNNIVNGTFLSFEFSQLRSQHDIKLGMLPSASRLLCHSRIKRWWMAPSFHKDADSIPVETQSLLIELDTLYSTSIHSNLSPSSSLVPSFPSKKYALIAPLIDFDRGFRATLYGSEGGYPAGGKNLAMRLESGDDQIKSKVIENVLYIAAGSDPYELLSQSYERIAKSMRTFRTRRQKLSPPGIDSFGYCTWDAFYSNVDSANVLQGVTSLSSIGFPPRFLIIDDGWQSTSNQKRIDDSVKSPYLVAEIQNSNNTARKSMSISNLDHVPENLTGTPISGKLASQQMVSKEDSPLRKFAVNALSSFYTEYVEKGKFDSFPVKLWAWLSKTILKDKLIDFFEKQTDFSKRLSSWKANSKFENPSEGKSLRGLVQTLKQDMGVNYVYVWHALAGYWGGVSENENDDMPRELNSKRSRFPTSVIERYINDASKAIQKFYEENANEKFSKLFHPIISTNLSFNSVGGNNGKSVKRSFSKPTPHLLQVEPALAWDPSSLVGVGGVALDRLEEMYYRMYSYLAEAGIDGVKVDAQSGIGSFGSGNGGGSNIARASVRAMEKNVRLFFGNPSVKALLGNSTSYEFADYLHANKSSSLKPVSKKPNCWNRLRILPTVQSFRNRIFFRRSQTNPFTTALSKEGNGADNLTPISLVGCMCHSTENLYNFYETSLARVSDDFYPKDDASQTVHLVSCAYNSVMIGEIAIADWDMFHSKHAYAELHAAARAISGGPLYVSDSPGNHNSSILKRLVLPNGRILRTLLPARPTVDCLFSDVMRDGKTALKLWTLNKMNAVIGVFNVQGASWDKSLRKYVRHDSHTLFHHNIETEIRPRNVNGNFSFVTSASFLRQHQTKDRMRTAPTSSYTEGLSKSSASDQMFLAWSSKHKRLHFLPSRNSVIKEYLQPRDWDVFTIHHLYKLSSATKYSTRNIPLGNTKLSPTEEFRKILKKASTEAYAPNDIFWCPLGLIDMMNSGGAIDEINIISRNMISLDTRGPGTFGIFTDTMPEKIIIDKIIDVPLASCDIEATNFGGYIIKFNLPEQGSSNRLLVETPVGPFSSLDLFDSNKITTNKSKILYALNDKLRSIVVSW